MVRHFRMLLVAVFGVLGIALMSDAVAQPVVHVSGRLPQNAIRVFSRDTLYQVSGNYVISTGAVLVVTPGTHVQFLPNGRIIDSAGGKIIADGTTQVTQYDFTPPGLGETYCTPSYIVNHISATNQDGRTTALTPYYYSMFYANNALPTGVTCSSPYRVPYITAQPIIFEGVAVNINSVEWGNFLILPGADSTYFRNCQFINFRKDTTVDRLVLYTTDTTSASLRLRAMSNGTGAAICSFSAKTFLRNCSFRNNVARLHGGAVAFMEFRTSPGSVIPNDDGRLAVASSDAYGQQVNNLTFVNNSVLNNFTQAAPVYNLAGELVMWNVNKCDGGALYLRGVSTRRSVSIGSIVVQDRWVFSGNTATNNQPTGSFTQGARGGAIFVDSLTALTVWNGTFLNNNANTPNWNAQSGEIHLGAKGGAIFADTALRIYDNAYFNGNAAGYGGAIYLGGFDFNSGRLLHVRGAGIVLSNNTARYDGGAIYTRADQNAIVGVGIDESNNQKVVFDNNRAGYAGGGVYNGKGIDTLDWTKFTNNQVHIYPGGIHNSVLGGGAIYAASATRVRGCDFILNHADTANGGAIYLYNPSNNLNRYFSEKLVSPVSGADTVADVRELTRFIYNNALRDTSDDHNTQRLQSSGLGGALFITVPVNVISFARTDSTFFSRVRFEQNTSYSGAAVYSDLYDMRLEMNRCLVANNTALSAIERNRDTINGISSRIAGAILYGEFEGPLPSYSGSYRGNAVYDNDARFVLRLPDSPILGIGAGGADTLRGNFWGDGTNSPNGGTKGSPNVRVAQYNALIPVNTFFFTTIDQSCFLQLPFESEPYFNYGAIPIGQIPDTLLFEGRVYDLLDKGTDIKTADYNFRINSPVEDWAIGEPRYLVSNLGPGATANVRRLTRDPYFIDGNSSYARYQTDFVGPHPLGYPLFLTAQANAGTDANATNVDPYTRNYTVYYVMNRTTGEIIRVNLKETDLTSNVFRARVDFVPDFISRDTLSRRQQENRPILDVLQLGPLSRAEYITSLDAAIDAASRYNDSVALGGRRTEGLPTQFGSGDFRYSNDVTPAFVRYYSGERYNALPVLTGDEIVVFSRSVLFKEGFTAALTRGLQFTIGDALKPSMTGYNTWMSQDNVNPNTRWLREDVKYPASATVYTYPNIPVFTAAGRDTNNMYDPRWLSDATKYTQLRYSWEVLADAGITARVHTWLKDTTFFGAYNETIQRVPNPFGPGGSTRTVTLSGSQGYMRLWGQPHNADIVPGGFTVRVHVGNNVPNKATEQLAEQVGDNNHSIFLYPAYLNCNHLQQDTVEIRNSDTTYTFQVFVQDSTPTFTNNPELVANLTDSLRYCWDANTDDESEDNLAATQGWDFRYGRTSYSFGDPLNNAVAKVQPSWMRTGYMVDKNGQPDTLGLNFQSSGLLKVETDSASAVALLTPQPQVNGELALDTVASVVVHDGHTGISRKTYAVHVNVEPYFTTTSLPSAKEDNDYNPTLLDTLRAALASDPNRADDLTYYLVYRDGALNSSLLDPSVFPSVTYDTASNSYKFRRDNYYYGTAACKFSGVPQVGAALTTPSWLKINPISGVLYGTPGLHDAPHKSATGNPDTVTVLVRDPYGLIAVHTYILDVDSTNHAPAFTNEPAVLCNLVGDTLTQDFTITDKDLGRDRPFTDTLTVTVVQPAGGVTITPSTIGGDGVSQTTANVTAHLSFTNPIGGTVIVVLQVSDKGQAIGRRTMIVRVSRKPAWRMDLTVANNAGGQQKLTFGTGYRATAMLDSDYCEFALPPIPPTDVFDARWQLSDTSGSFGSVRDFRDSTSNAVVTYQGLVQAGGSNSVTNYPIFFVWSKTVPGNAGQLFLRDRFGGRVFNIDMRTGTGYVGPQCQMLTSYGGDNTLYALQVNNSQVTGFYIVRDPLNSVDPVASGAPSNYELAQNYPNPFNPTTNIRFGIPTAQQTRLEVIDVMGRVIATLVNDHLGAGFYEAQWNGRNDAGLEVGSGTYFYRLTSGSFVEMKQMNLMK